jgi:diguanylate cyclase (GGDEF)-like protein
MSGLSARVLLVEDLPTEAELALRELKRAGLAVTHRLVASEADFAAALRRFGPDVILSDFSMPHFDGMQALRMAREFAPTVPFIFVSGTLGEEHAIAALKNGATDYVMKGNLARLAAAVERAIAEAQVMRERLRAQTELEIAQERLTEREAGLRRAQQMARLSHVITGLDGAFESWSDTLPRLAGAPLPRSMREWLNLVHPDDRALFGERALQAASTSNRSEVQYRLRSPSGAWIHLRHTMEALAEATPDASPRWFNTIQDVTEQKLAEESIRRLNRVYAVLSGINGLIVRTSSRDELFEEACRLAVEAGQFRMAWIGLVDAAAEVVKPVASAGNVGGFFDVAPLVVTTTKPGGHGLAGRAIREKRPVVSNDVQADPQRLMKEECAQRGINSLAVMPLLTQGEAVGIFALYAADTGFFDDEEMRLLMELTGDIAFALDHIEKAERLDYLSYYDGVTGLANRTLFLERVTQSILSAAETGGRFAIWLLDIERFRTVNDALGRRAGDALLQQVARRVQTHAGAASFVARVAADHFAVVAGRTLDEEAIARLTEQRFAECFGTPYEFDGQKLRLSARAGIAMYPTDGTDAEALLRSAEAALRKAKASGERYLFHAPEMSERIAERLSLENKLRQALEKNEFVLHYQPKVDVRDRRIVGMEALIRWRSPEFGLVPPVRFIALLEETGLILEAGSWALSQAALDHRRWTEMGLAPLRVAVNVSPIQLRQRNFVATVEKAIVEGVSPAAIDLEITESLVMEDIQANIGKLKEAKALGLRIAIDDFGTGYSSLAYLAKLPVETLKIDRSFINGMEKDRDATTLVQTMVGLAHSLRLTVVAEGVETAAQAKSLLELGCDQMQGYLISKPLPAEDLESFLRQVSP